MTQPANKIAIDPETYNWLLRRKRAMELDSIGINVSDFELHLNTYRAVVTGVNYEAAWKYTFDQYVYVNNALAHPDMETDAQFIADWTAWVEQMETHSND